MQLNERPVKYEFVFSAKIERVLLSLHMGKIVKPSLSFHRLGLLENMKDLFVSSKAAALESMMKER